jgi:hypothetical protein
MTQMRPPIILVGTGRCGSTFLHRLLARHDELGWLSTWNEVFPTQAWLARFSNLYRNDRLSTGIRHRRWFPKPFEAYKFWEHYLPGFSRRDRPLCAEDVTAEGIAPVRDAVERILRHQGKERLLAKVTGWSRIAYFDRIFPDALFVFLDREHKSVVSSWIQAGWLDVSSALDSAAWQWGAVPPAYREIWQDLGGGPSLSAAVKIQLDLDDIRANMSLFPGRCHTLRYEELITRPLPTLRELLAFCGLGWTSAFAAHVESLVFYDSRDRWRKYQSDEDGRRLDDFFRRAGTLLVPAAGSGPPPPA